MALGGYAAALTLMGYVIGRFQRPAIGVHASCVQYNPSTIRGRINNPSYIFLPASPRLRVSASYRSARSQLAGQEAMRESTAALTVIAAEVADLSFLAVAVRV